MEIDEARKGKLLETTIKELKSIFEVRGLIEVEVTLVGVSPGKKRIATIKENL